MNFLKISIILPFPVTKPGGGAKIMYEYANRLHNNGHNITIYHSIKRPFKKTTTPVWIKQIIFFFRGVSSPKWFALHKSIKSVIVPEIVNKYLQDADIVFSTWWQMAYAINDLASSKGKKINLIQGYEIWQGQELAVNESFKLPLCNVVISKHLQKLIEEKSKKKPYHLPIAIDDKKFLQTIPIKNRDPFSVIMMYSEDIHKGTTYGLEAFKIVKKKYKQLKIILFGVFSPPNDLPDWISYYQNPKQLADLYNSASIFCSPSLTEGWALPPAEAMACGCAVVCTKIGGHLDYAIHEQTALLVEPKNIQDMSEKIITLLDNPILCYKIAENGYHLITTAFSWDNSISSLQTIFHNELKH
jgi:glycosyltransferase involved in cell wall biosynthesis